MIFKVDDLDIEEIINASVNSDNATHYINDLLGTEELSKEALAKISNRFKVRLVYKISKDGQNVGEVTFRGEESKPVIGIGIEKPFRNQGIGYKVLKEILMRRSEVDDVEYYVYSVRNDNIPSIKLVEKLCGVRVKTFKLFEHKDLAIFTYHIPANT